MLHSFLKINRKYFEPKKHFPGLSFFVNFVMLYCINRDPISIFISSWDYYEYDKKLEMTIEEFAYAVGEGLLEPCRYQLLQNPNFKVHAII